MVEWTVSKAHDRSGMGHGGFTEQELRDIFNLDPDRPEDRPAIAALQASSTRLLDEPRTAAAQRNVRHVVRQLLRRHRRNAA
jgi:hypothetical protein